MTLVRTYEKTHPWLKFSLDLRPAPAHLWVMLGECQSKCEHISGVPLRPETSQKLHLVYLAKGASATTAIEGNTLTEQELLQHLEGRLKLPPSREYLAQEGDNIVVACNLIGKEVAGGETPPLTPERVRLLNKLVLQGLSLPEDVAPGEMRRHPVGVGRYRGAPAEDCDYLLGKLCQWLEGDTFLPPQKMQKEMQVLYAILKAVVAHLYLAWIHPFGDGNGRTARLIEFQVLLTSGVPAPAAHLLSNHYNQTRTEYARQLEAASQSGGDVIPFVLYAVRGFRDGLREQLGVIRDQQWDVAWRNFVHEAFRERPTAVQKRQRDLVLDLSRQAEPVRLSELAEITPRVAKAYAGKTARTLARDVKSLLEMGLVVEGQNGLRAYRERILAFLPFRADAPP